MTPETEIRIYEMCFGENVRPTPLNDIQKDDQRLSFTEGDLIDEIKKISNEIYAFTQMKESLQEIGWDINEGVSE